MATAARKEYELLFKLTAALGSNFNRTFQAASNATKSLQGNLTKISSLQRNISGYKKQVEAIEKNREKLKSLSEGHDSLQKELKETEEKARTLRKELTDNKKKMDLTDDVEEYKKLSLEHERLQKELDKTEKKKRSLKKQMEANQRSTEQTTKKIQEQERRLSDLGDELKRSGVNVNNLSKENQKLAKSYNSIKKSQEAVAKINVAKASTIEAIKRTRKQILGTIGIITGLATAIYAGPVQASIEFESAMADVVKVVDGLKDTNTGELTKEYYELKNEIIDLSTKIPMTAKELTEIAASAGQAGIARKEVAKFAEDAAKMGVAFDTTAEQAGDWMAKWRTSFKMSQQEVVELADKINYLGNTSAANALQISTIVTKIGPLGEVAGLASGEIAALGATLASIGVQEDVAATGIKKLITSMTAGTAATKRQDAVLKKLGISATDLAKRMQKDAQGAILDFLGAIQKLPEAEQTAALKNYFGEQSVAAIAPLLTNLDYLRQQFNKVGDAALYAGSMEEEYAARSDTTQNKIQLARNSLTKLSMTLGDTFLPYIGQAAEKLTVLINKFADFASENPETVKTIMKVVGGLLAFKLASSTAKLGFLEIKGGVLNVMSIFNKLKGNLATANLKFMEFKGKASGLGSTLSTAFTKLGSTKIGGAFTSIGGTIGKTITTGIGKAMGGLGGIIAKSPIGKLGTMIAKGPLGKLGGIFGKLGGGLTKVLGPLGKVLGLLGGKTLPIFFAISAVIAIISILKDRMEDVRNFVGRIFGDKGVEIFDKVVGAISNVGEMIKGVFSNENMDSARNFIHGIFGDQGVAVFDGFINILQTVWGVIQGMINFATTYVKPVIEEIFSFIVNTVLPLIAQKFAEWAPTISNIIQGLWTVIQGVATQVMNVVQFLMPTIKAIIGSTVDSITGIIGGLLKAIQGVIDFVVGVFTGDWKQAWEGVKNIFGGVWEAMKSLFKAPLNWIISGINTFIRGINKIKIPDWVPGVGGKGFNIKEIPMLAKGSNYTPDTFIAGEEGAELITNAKGRKVFTAIETKNIFNNLNAINKINIKERLMDMLQSMSQGYQVPQLMPTPSFPQLAVSTPMGGDIKVEITNSPTIIIDGQRPDDLEQKLEKNNQSLLAQVKEMLRKEKEDRERTIYA